LKTLQREDSQKGSKRGFILIRCERKRKAALPFEAFKAQWRATAADGCILLGLNRLDSSWVVATKSNDYSAQTSKSRKREKPSDLSRCDSQ
jgi:hypothetical protein